MVKIIVLNISAKAATDRIAIRVAVTNDALILMDTTRLTSLKGPLGSLKPIEFTTESRIRLSSSIDTFATFSSRFFIGSMIAGSRATLLFIVIRRIVLGGFFFYLGLIILHV